MLQPPDAFSPAFYTLNMIYGRQQNALRDNKRTREDHLLKSENWIRANMQNRTIGQPITAKPIMPKELVVNDNGTEFYQAFADLKEPELPVENVIVNPVPGAFTSQSPATDRTDQLIAMMRVINEKLDRALAQK
jgi:hypothetical protein